MNDKARLERIWANSPDAQPPTPDDTPDFHQWMAEHALPQQNNSRDLLIEALFADNARLIDRVRDLTEQNLLLRILKDDRTFFQRVRDRLVYGWWEGFCEWVRRER